MEGSTRGKFYLALGVATAIVAPLVYCYQEQLTSLMMPVQSSQSTRRYTVLYATTTGTAKIFAHRVLQALLNAGVENVQITIKDVKDYDVDTLVKEVLTVLLHTYIHTYIHKYISCEHS